MKFKQTLISGIVSGSLLAPAFAIAEDSGMLEEIVVTAQKRAQNVQDVPIAITAISSSDLARSGIQDITRIGQVTPGFEFGQSGGDARPAVRGVRTENIQLTGDPTIGFFVDDVYQTRTFMAMANFVDVDRVEILRGPQGTLFGRNSLGGAVSVYSKAPSTEGIEGYVNATLGNYSKRKFEGAVNLPVSDTFAVRVAGMVEDADGWLENSSGEDLFDTDDEFGRISLKFTPNDNLEITARASIAKQGGIGPGAYGYASFGTYRDPSTGRIALPQYGGVSFPFMDLPARDGIADVDFPGDMAGPVDLGFPILSDPFKVDFNTDGWVDTDSKSYSLQVVYDFGPVTFKSTTAKNDVQYERFYDADYAAVEEQLGDLFITAGTIQGQTNDVDSFTQELQLASNSDGNLEWVIGGFYLKDELEEFFLWGIEPDHPQAATLDGFGFFNSTLSNPNTGQPFLVFLSPTIGTNGGLEVESLAVFGQATYSFNDTLSGTLGLRYTEDEKTLTDGTLTKDFDEVTYRFGLEYQYADDVLFYGSYSTGFLAGGLNPATAPVEEQTIDEQTNTAIEVGMKSRFWDNRAQLNVSIYRNEIEDIVVQIPGVSLSSIRLNGGELEVTGLEAELKLRPSENLRLDVSLALMDSELKNFVTGNSFRSAAGTPPEEATVDLSGNDGAQTPDFTATIIASYDFDLGDMGFVTPQIQYAYNSGYEGDDFNTDVGRQDSYGLLDFRLGWSSAEANWTVQAFVENATEEEIKVRSVPFVYGGGIVLGDYAPPRMYGVTFGYNF